MLNPVALFVISNADINNSEDKKKMKPDQAIKFKMFLKIITRLHDKD